MAATLNLPINNNLGFAYIVPYNRKFKDKNNVWQEVQEAQFPKANAIAHAEALIRLSGGCVE